jgi:putative aldouronate transport system substrate-binding protein
MKEFATKYVLNNQGDKEWEEWLKKAEALGYEKLVKVYNDAQKRFDAQ